jgi:hypothetical protein
MIDMASGNRLRTKRLAACLAVAIALDDAASAASDRFATARNDGGGRVAGIAARATLGSTPSSTRSQATPPSAHVPVLPVTRCDDDGSPGTLRSVVAGAESSAIVDLSALTCSSISLANGAIAVPFESMTFVGPGSSHLSLDANQSYRRIIEHSGSGTLRISGLRLSGGWAPTPAYGGCLYSAGSLDLDDVAVVFCKAVGAPGQATKGGGIYAAGSVMLAHSIVSGNQSNPDTVGFGGGVFAGGALYVSYSTVSGNYSLNLGGGGGYGGGLFALGNVSIFASTISDNYAINVGGVSIAGFAATAFIANSTVSGNLAARFVAGVYSNTPLGIYNSTIAFNAATQQSASYVTAGGLQIYGTGADLQSSIIANNTAAGVAFDVGIGTGGSVTGANNLIRTASNLMPADTITDDPQLLPLQNNGGDTATHALAPASPAIDHGNTANPSSFDQRGFGYVRVFGAAADIGAYELQVVDFIFRNGFDGGM